MFPFFIFYYNCTCNFNGKCNYNGLFVIHGGERKLFPTHYELNDRQKNNALLYNYHCKRLQQQQQHVRGVISLTYKKLPSSVYELSSPASAGSSGSPGYISSPDPRWDTRYRTLRPGQRLLLTTM